MLAVKACHRGLRGQARFFGLEPIELLLLCPGFFACSVLLHSLALALAVSTMLGAALRLLSFKQLPGFTLTLLNFLLDDKHLAVLGAETLAPLHAGDHGLVGKKAAGTEAL